MNYFYYDLCIRNMNEDGECSDAGIIVRALDVIVTILSNKKITLSSEDETKETKECRTFESCWDRISKRL